MKIPDLTREDVKQALEALLPELDEITKGRHASRKYDLLWNGHRFPPKVVLSRAVEIATGKSFPEELF